jgi:DNA-binding transcriptional ArsR family regulator
MFALELDVQDLADTRFTISPLHEAVASLWTVYGGRAHPEQRRWAGQARACPGIRHELLASMVSPRGWIPDFIAPPPPAARPRLAGQLVQIRQTPPAKVLADVQAAYGPAPLPGTLAGLIHDPGELRDQVAGALEQYWRLAIAPGWPRMRALLEADLLHRGLQLAQAGPAAAFAGLDRRIRWRDGVVAVDIVRQWRRRLPVGGRGLRLLPSLFSTVPHLPVDTLDPPVLAYPARGTAALWPSRPAPAPAAARNLIGRPRAQLLALLRTPASTTELAAQLGVTRSAVSQHLQVLAAAGLVHRARAGRIVLYRQSAFGAGLIQGGHPPGDHSL